MPKSCTICTSSQRRVIEKDMLAHSLREVARRHKTSKDVVHRHRTHMQIETTAAAEACGAKHGEEVLAQLKELNEKARVLVTNAEAAGDARTELLGIRELKGLLELQARLTGQLELRPQHNSLHLHLDAERMAQIAQTYLARHPAAERPLPEAAATFDLQAVSQASAEENPLVESFDKERSPSNESSQTSGAGPERG